MSNLQVPPLPFPGECWRHRFNMDIIQEDWEEFMNEEMQKWQAKVIKFFGEDPKIQPRDPKQQGSNTAIIGSNMDFLAINLWPKMEKDDLRKMVSVCKAWGEDIVKKYFIPDLTFKYNRSIICDGRMGVFKRKYRIVHLGNNRSFEKLIQYKCTCQIWHEAFLEGTIPLFPGEDYSDDDDDPDITIDEEPDVVISFANLSALLRDN